jgi:hypothetical protein
MPRTPIALAVLSLSLLWHPVFAGPPEGPTGKMVVSDVVQLRDDVLRLEKEVERDNSDPSAADDLDVARARLAAAEGRMGASRAAWKKIIASREAEMRQWQRSPPKWCTETDKPRLRGRVAEARCSLAELEGNRAVLAQELPKVIAWHETMLLMWDKLREAKAAEPEETELERRIRKELRQCRQRLEALQRR